ncbi:MAG: helix-turn-helix transcriptional regulator [Candidatus Gastranaerophilales bacterium]|nr:helix-turn-helix transcriptional regulator [Candidatus Gastranaerophilales bacterium]
MKMDEKDTRKLLGENIRRIRWSKNMTQEAFSEKIGIEPSSLSNIENGKSLPSTQTILNIQQQFDVSPNDIFDFDIDYVKSAQNLEEEIVNSVKAFDVEKKRVLYKIVKAIEV